MRTNLTKAELAKKLSEITGLTRTGVISVLDALGDTIAEAVNHGTTVVTGFGRFKPRVRPARVGRNPRTGEAIEIAEKLTVSFTPATPKS